MLQAALTALEQLLEQPTVEQQGHATRTEHDGVQAPQLPMWLLDSFLRLAPALLQRLTMQAIETTACSGSNDGAPKPAHSSCPEPAGPCVDDSSPSLKAASLEAARLPASDPAETAFANAIRIEPCASLLWPAQSQQQEEQQQQQQDEQIGQISQRVLAMAVELLCNQQLHDMEAVLHSVLCCKTQAISEVTR